MATLADIVKRERSSGSSRTGALASAIGKKTLETIDPRRMFNQSGLLTSLFPSLKTYKADSGKSKVGDASKELSASTAPILEQVVTKLDGLDVTMRLVAKNTMTMPGMSRDMNIMRQNIGKLVKLQGGKASTRADNFFLRAFEREKATEAEIQAAKDKRVAGKATPTKEGTKKEDGGFLNTLFAPLMASLAPLITSIKNFGTGLAEILGISKFLTGEMGLLRAAITAILSPIGLMTLAIGGLAYLLMKFDSREKQFLDESGNVPGGMTPDMNPGVQMAPNPEPEPGQASSLNPTAGADSDGSYARAEMAKLLRQGTSPTSVSGTATSSTSPTQVPKKSVTSGSDGELLDFIAAKESRGDYNMVYGQGSVPGLSDMTIAQVLEYQNQLIAQGQKSAAVGRYQFIRSTLAEEAKAAGIDINKEKFTPEMQDRLILNRLNRIRGLDKFKKGEITAQQFAENLSMEFASLPSPIKGGGTKSYYEGIAGNKSLTGIDNVYAAIQSSKQPSGVAVASASSTVDSARMAAMTPASIIPAMTSLTTPKAPSLQKQQLNIPTTIDTDLFDGLIARVSEYA